MKRIAWVVPLACGLISGTTLAVRAQDAGGRATRIDVGAFYQDFSTGRDQYGPWSGIYLKGTNRPPLYQLGFTGILELVAKRHDDEAHENEGAYAVGSAYYDWSPRVYSFSSVGGSTGEPFVQFSAHQEIDVKLTPERNFVLGAGLGYLKYHTVNSNFYVALGGTYYWGGTFASDLPIVLQYHYRRTFADPVDAQLNTHILAVGFGRYHHRWTTVRYLYGQEVFRAGGGGAPTFDPALRGQVISLEHEAQLTDRFGVVAGVAFTHKRHEQEDRTLFSGPGGELRFFWNL